MTFRSIDHSSAQEVRVTIDQVTLPPQPPIAEPAPRETIIQPYDDSRLKAHIDALHAKIIELGVPAPPPPPAPQAPEFNYEWLEERIGDIVAVFALERQQLTDLIADLIKAEQEAEGRMTFSIEGRAISPTVMGLLTVSAVSLLSAAVIIVLQYLHIQL